MNTYFRRFAKAFFLMLAYAIASFILAIASIGALLAFILGAVKEEFSDTMSALRSLFIFINQQNKLSWKKS